MLGLLIALLLLLQDVVHELLSVVNSHIAVAFLLVEILPIV